MSYYSKVTRETSSGTETIIDLTSDTVTAGTLKKGYTAHDKTGAPITGTLDTSGTGGGELKITYTDNDAGGQTATITVE